MTLVNPRPWLQQAQRDGFAIGAFNANTLEQVQAIVQAAQAERAPVIVQISHRALHYAGSGSETLGLRYMALIGQTAAHSVDVPVALHLDHATADEVVQAIALGFTSVMFDGGDLSLAQNIETMRRLRALAHAAGVCIEAEVGAVPKPDSAGHIDLSGAHTDPADAAAFVAATGVDVLAIAVGSVHAATEKRLTLDLDRLAAVRAVVDIPLVLHGSSGVINEHIAAGIRLGLCKVNVATQLNQAFTGAARTALAANPDLVDPRPYLGQARAAMVETVRERIRFVGAAGKAASQ